MYNIFDVFYLYYECIYNACSLVLSIEMIFRNSVSYKCPLRIKILVTTIL